MNYVNCVKTDSAYDENGEAKETVVYTDGSGSFVFGEDGTLTWNDEKEHIADGTTFAYAS